MNKMYKYLKEHSYISETKKSNYQFELSEERANCIACKYENLVEELDKENKKLKEKLEKIEKLIGCYDEVVGLENQIERIVGDSNE